MFNQFKEIAQYTSFFTLGLIVVGYLVQSLFYGRYNIELTEYGTFTEVLFMWLPIFKITILPLLSSMAIGWLIYKVRVHISRASQIVVFLFYIVFIASYFFYHLTEVGIGFTLFFYYIICVSTLFFTIYVVKKFSERRDHNNRAEVTTDETKILNQYEDGGFIESAYKILNNEAFTDFSVKHNDEVLSVSDGVEYLKLVMVLGESIKNQSDHTKYEDDLKHLRDGVSFARKVHVESIKRDVKVIRVTFKAYIMAVILLVVIFHVAFRTYNVEREKFKVEFKYNNELIKSSTSLKYISRTENFIFMEESTDSIKRTKVFHIDGVEDFIIWQ